MKSLKTRIIAGFAAAILVTGIFSGCSAKSDDNGKSEDSATQTTKVDSVEQKLTDFLANSKGEVPAELKNKLVEKIYQANKDIKSLAMDFNMKMGMGGQTIPMDMRMSGTVKPYAMQLEMNADLGLGKQSFIVRMFASSAEDLKDLELYQSMDNGKTWKKENTDDTKKSMKNLDVKEMMFVQKELLSTAKFEVKDGKIHVNFDGKKFLELNKKNGIMGQPVQGNMKVSQLTAVYDPKTLFINSNSVVVEGDTPQGKVKVEVNGKVSGINSTKAPEKPKVS